MNKYEIELILQETKLKKTKPDFEKLKLMLSKEKELARANYQEILCNEIWCLEQVLNSLNTYFEMFSLLKKNQFFKAWELMEHLELNFKFLHPHFNSEFEKYGLDLISLHVKQFQSLYPYKVFFSPEILELKKKCNICGKEVSIRKPCGHRVGQLYNGEMCIRIIEDAKILGIALVENPLQKYSVPFLSDQITGKPIDHYDYSLVKWVIERLINPFDSWKVIWSKIRHPHSFFIDVKKDEDCPCGSSMMYSECCLKENGVIRPHCEVLFENPDTSKPMSIVYHY